MLAAAGLSRCGESVADELNTETGLLQPPEVWTGSTTRINAAAAVLIANTHLRQYYFYGRGFVRSVLATYVSIGGSASYIRRQPRQHRESEVRRTAAGTLVPFPSSSRS